jgi:hypothetical protein
MRAEHPISFAALLPVGPRVSDVAALSDVVDSLVHYEPGIGGIFVVDDIGGRDLAGAVEVPPSCVFRSIDAPSKEGTRFGFGVGIAAAVVAGLAELSKYDFEFILKMDTDALAIAPFSEKVAARLRTDEKVGQVGCCYKTPKGFTRIFEPHASMARFHARSIAFDDDGRFLNRLNVNLLGKPGKARRILKMARRNGYQWGEHCIGGAYALSARALERMDELDLLDVDVWRLYRWAEDVLVSMLVRAAGFEFADMVADHEPFGVTWKGLEVRPDELLDHGYSLIHSLKNDRNLTETDIRGFFRRVREGDTPRVRDDPRLEPTTRGAT